MNGRQRLTPLNAVNQNSDSTRAETTHGSSSQVHHNPMFLTVYRSLYMLGCPNGSRRHCTRCCGPIHYKLISAADGWLRKLAAKRMLVLLSNAAPP